MREEALLKAFHETGALKRGHFQLSSGLHSGVYFQSALVLQHPDRAEVLGRALAKLVAVYRPEVVVGPALGGLIIGWEVACELGVRGIFTERQDGVMCLRRGFEIGKGRRVVIVEDVITTGKSTRETMAVIEAAGGTTVAVAALVDRSGGTAELNAPMHALLSLPVETNTPDECPECQAGVPLDKPGSRPGEATLKAK
ncbi:MAG: orotate phosphoribosyltransferase [Gemmatimonadota bacterium]|nr:MAG: orotate phosphoribosyltransferase [Gemmatimonadota bacterium]